MHADSRPIGSGEPSSPFEPFSAQPIAGLGASPRRLLTAEDLADRWRVPKSHVYRLTREGAIPTVRLGRYYRYRLEAIEAFEQHGAATLPEPPTSLQRGR